MAIFYALCSPELEVVGLTTIFGNAHTTTCTRNALKLLEIAGRTDIPVAEGAYAPSAQPYRGPATFVHGEDGQGDIGLEPPTTSPIAADAASFIVETVMAAPGQITLVPIGPLTNIAAALQAEPRLAANLAGIVLMGGNAFVNGNASPAAEANIINDPEAADVVFAADCPLVMAGLDVTEETLMTNADLAAYSAMDNPMAAHIASVTPYYSNFYRQRLGLDGIHVHDSTCISYLVAAQHFQWREHPVCVDVGNSVCRGKTQPALRVSDREVAWQGRRDVRILTAVDDRAVIELEHSRLADPPSS
jgi:inosine-uridine nucleoside N-ribohydrolase